MLAKVRLKLGKTDAALEALSTMVEHDEVESSVWNTPSSVLRDLSTDFYFPKKKDARKTLEKLELFTELSGNSTFDKLLRRVQE